MQTTRHGVFVSGAFQGPVDIPESVLTASGAGSQCGELLSYRRWKLSRERVIAQYEIFIFTNLSGLKYNEK
jgi:heterodisulfide reductase subunit A